MMEWVAAERGGFFQSTEDLRALAENPEEVRDGEIGILFPNSDGDGPVVYSTNIDALIETFERALGDLRCFKDGAK